MNFWTPTFHSWGKGFDAADMPWYVLYDYVEVYKYNAERNEFDLDWRDDFNAFDTTRWHKASGSFETNSSTFSPENVYTENGNLVIKMEPMESHIEEHHDEEDRMHHEASMLHARDHSDTRHSRSLVQDTIPGLKSEQFELNMEVGGHLGHLEPRHDLIDEHSRDYHVTDSMNL